MKRRSFLQTAVAASATVAISAHSTSEASPIVDASPGQSATHGGSFAVDDNQVTFYTDAVTRSVNVMVVADTHLFTDDDRGKPYHEFSGRMAKAYNSTTHFKTGQPTSPEQSFQAALARANANDVDLLALVGDIFSFPSEAAIDWVSEQLDGVKMPWLYVAGNHDWHYEILPEQLAFLRMQLRSGQPLVLLVHIPLYAPGRPVGFGCGHPQWGADTDRNHIIERRPKWPESGHTQTTLDFHREVFHADANHLLGVFAGHIHRQSVDVVNGIPQFVTNANAVGAFMDIRFVPSR